MANCACGATLVWEPGYGYVCVASGQKPWRCRCVGTDRDRRGYRAGRDDPGDRDEILASDGEDMDGPAEVLPEHE